MASRVNVGFVIVLGVVLAGLGIAAAFVGVRVLNKSGDDFMRLGDEALAAGDVDEAVSMFGRGVNRQPENVDWIRRWRTAMEQKRFDTEAEFGAYYRTQYALTFAGISMAAGGDVDLHREYLLFEWEPFRRRQVSLQGLEGVVGLVNEVIGRLPSGEATSGSASLRRFRGIARARMMSPPINSELQEDVREQTLRDLRDALDLDPNDTEVVLSLYEWHRAESERARRGARPADAQRLDGEAMAILDGAIERIGDRVELLSARMMHVASRVQRSSPTGRVPLAVAFADAQRDLERIEQVMLTGRPVEPDPWTVPSVVEVMFRATQRDIDRVDSSLRAMIERRPDEPMLRFVRAVSLREGRRFSQAMELYESLSNLADPTMSLEGLFRYQVRRMASSGRVDTALMAAETVTGEERSRWLDRAARARDEYVERYGANEPSVMSMSGRIAYLRGDFGEARRLLGEYDTVTGRTDGTALRFLGRSLRELNNLGGARDALAAASRLAGETDLLVLIELADVQSRLRDRDAALATLEVARGLAPDNEQVLEMTNRLRDTAMGEQSDDPVVRTLSIADGLVNRSPPDVLGAIDLLKSGLAENPDEARLGLALTRLLMLTGRIDEALEVISDGLGRDPNNTAYQRLDRVLKSEDPVESALGMIDEARAGSELERRFHRYQFLNATSQEQFARSIGFAQRGDVASATELRDRGEALLVRAQSELRAALEAGPRDGRVLDAAFRDALTSAARARERGEAAAETEAIGRARTFASRAGEVNADNVGGLTYRADIENFQGRRDAAVQLLREATAIDRLNPGLWRSIGELLTALGRPGEAVTAIEESLTIKPDDPRAIVAYLSALEGAGRLEDALRASRRSRAFAEGNRAFVDRWLDLEGRAPGGDRELAINMRRAQAQHNPTDFENTRVLVQLFAAANRWDEAREVIDGGLGGPNDGAFRELLARWYASQGRTKESLATMQSRVDAVPEGSRTPGMLAALAEFQLASSLTEQAIETLRLASRAGGGFDVNSSARLADILAAVGQSDEAVALYRRVLETADEQAKPQFALRYAELLVRLDRAGEAASVLESLPDRMRSSAGVMVFRAGVAGVQGNNVEAKRLYNLAVREHRRDPSVYVARARFIMEAEPELVADAIGDMEEAIRLNPSDPTNRSMLGDIYAMMGRWSDAAREYVRAVGVAPRNSRLRQAVVDELLRIGRGEEATSLLSEGIEFEPDNIRWRLMLGELRQRDGSRRGALQQFEQAWSRSPSPQTAGFYARTLLSGDRPDVSAALVVLNDSKAETESNPALRVFRAAAQKLSGNERGATADLDAAFGGIEANDRAKLQEVVAALESVFTDARERMSIMAARRPAGAASGWFGLFECVQMYAAELLEDAQEDLTELAASTEDVLLQAAAYRMLGQISYQRGEYEAAAGFWRSSLQRVGNDAETLNNLAYTLAAQLNEPSEALGYSERAVAMVPRSSAFLDTLGATLIRLGELDRAEATLDRAALRAINDSERAPVELHRAELALARGNANAALAALDRLDSIRRVVSSVDQLYGERAAELRRRAEGR